MNIMPMKKFKQQLLPAILLSLALPVAAQQAQPNARSGPGEVAAPQGVSAEAQAIINRMTAYLRGLPAFSIESQSSRDEVLPFGFKMQNNETGRLVFRRPDHLRVEVDGDIRNRVFYFNGSTLTMYSPDNAVYAKLAKSGTLKSLIDGMLDAGIEMPMIDVLYQIGEGSLTADVINGGLVGESRIDGVDCYHLAFRQATLDWQLWVEKGERPLPRRIVITDRYEFGNPQYQTTLRWNVRPKITNADFEFNAPKGVTEIPFKSPVSNPDSATTGGKE